MQPFADEVVHEHCSHEDVPIVIDRPTSLPVLATALSGPNGFWFDMLDGVVAASE